MRFLIAFAFALCSTTAHAALPFFVPPAPTGDVDVTLHNTENVPPNTPTLVTFGFPFPRGSITTAQLSTLRVTRNGTEVPAFVEALTPWRHRSNASIDGASVRVARIQIQHSFASAFPAAETIVVSWGGAPRTQSRPALVDPRSAWHPVTSGSFLPQDNVFEPDVYAVLPASWLSQGLLKPSRSTTFAPDNLEARDSPAAMDAIGNWPAFREAERAFKNNFYTMINRDDPLVAPANLIPYRTEFEPWLYDRAATMFVLYFRSGYFTALREAVRNAQFYANHVDMRGYFDLRADDTKYSYAECLAYTYWLTGDSTVLPDLVAATDVHDSDVHVWTPSLGFWTERDVAFKLLARVVAYEVLGTTPRRDGIDTMISAFTTHQNGSNGQIPAQRVDGGLYHTGLQHGDWDAQLGGSSWMSALLSDALVRAYATDESTATATLVRRLGNFMRATSVQAPQQYDGAMRASPLYAMLLNGADAAPGFGPEEEHSLEVAAQIAWAYYFSQVLGAPDTALRDTALNLYATYDVGVNFWIRPTAPASGLSAYRVNPPRKWGWEHRTSDGIAFALTEAPAEVPLFANGFE